MGLFDKRKPGNPSHSPVIVPTSKNSYELFRTLDRPRLPKNSQAKFVQSWKDSDGHTWSIHAIQETSLDFTFTSADQKVKFSVNLIWVTGELGPFRIAYSINTDGINKNYVREYGGLLNSNDELPTELNELACRVFLVLQEYLLTQHPTLIEAHFTGAVKSQEESMKNALTNLMGGRMISDPPATDGGLGRKFR